MNKVGTFFFIIIMTFSVHTNAQTITVYKGFDDKGVAHFSYIMPKSGDYTTFEMKKPPPKLISTTKEQADDMSLSEFLAKKAKEKCEQAKTNLKTLSDFKEVKFQDNSGKERVLSKQDKIEYKKQAEKRIELFCNQ